MRISANNRLLQFAYLGTERWNKPGMGYTTSPKSVSLCALFWRIVLRLFLAVVVGVLLFSLVMTTIQEPLVVFSITALCALIVGFIMLGEYMKDRAQQKRWENEGLPKEDGWIVTVIKGIKGKFCPIILIDNGVVDEDR